MKNFPVLFVLSVLFAGAALAQESAAPPPAVFTVEAGADRDVVMPGKTYLSGFASYRSNAARPGGGRRAGGPGGASSGTGPGITVAWSKASGPGAVTFADATRAETTATFSQTGVYVLSLTGRNFGWLPTQADEAMAHIAKAIRESQSDGTYSARPWLDDDE